MTLAFAVLTALSLLTLTAVTLHLDDQARERDARDAVQRDSAAVSLVTAAGHLDLDDFERSVQQGTPTRWAVISQGVLLVAGPDARAVPDDAELSRVAASARLVSVKGVPQAVPGVFLADDERGLPVEWVAKAALPIGGAAPPGSAMLVGEPVPRARQHAALAGALLLAVLLLTLIAAVGGHLISGRAMRPALQGLEQQEQFLVEAAHELRTPLSTLRLVVDGTGADRWGRAERQVRRLERIVESLLLRARADAGHLDVRLVPLRLDQLVEQTVVELGAADGRVELDLQPSIVTGEPQLLDLAVRNLVENSLRHASAAAVRVRVRDGTVTVEDGGPGIAAGDRDRVLHRGVTDGAGTGSGLALVVWAVRLQHGTLDLRDTPGGGLTAVVQVPPVRRRASSSPHEPVRTLDT